MSDRDLLAYAVTQANNIAADLKNIARDVTGLMYGRDRNGELRLRDYVAIADTNTQPPTDCESYVWAVRSQAIALAEYLEQFQGARAGIACPCCGKIEFVEEVRSGRAGWKLVVDTHSENIVDGMVVPVEEWQCKDCAPYSHSEMNKEGAAGE
jgi:hypothetical protein